jgi:hypothetical protein
VRRLVTHRLRASVCACGEQLDAASSAPGNPTPNSPTPGAFTFCMYCARIYRFGEDLVLVPLSVAEFERTTEIDDEQKHMIRTMQRAIIAKARIPS